MDNTPNLNPKVESKVAKHSHVAVHAIQYRNEKGDLVEIAPKTEFSPRAIKEIGDVGNLEKRGAIRRLTKDDLASEVVKS
jgi:hypothetical protein